MRVLVVHPQATTRQRVTEWLTPFNYTVDEASDADSVPQAVRETTYDVVLVSTGLGGRDVGDLVAEIKRGPNGWITAVILIDQNLSYDAAMTRLGRGAYDFLVEPLNPAELVARVEAARRQSSLQGELMGQTRRLETLMSQDALTGLSNRRFMFSQLRALLSGARRHRRPVSVVMIDLDHFKRLNDRYGHDVGDRALIAVADALRDRLRAEDYVGRLGGEEFLALLPDTGEPEARAVAESLRRCASDVHILSTGGEPVSVTASIGWATWDGESAEDLVRRADKALYAAKAAGRDLVRRG